MPDVLSRRDQDLPTDADARYTHRETVLLQPEIMKGFPVASLRLNPRSRARHDSVAHVATVTGYALIDICLRHRLRALGVAFEAAYTRLIVYSFVRLFYVIVYGLVLLFFSSPPSSFS